MEKDPVEDWVVLELSSRSDGEDPDVVRKALIRALPNADVFIPAVITDIGNDRSVHYLVEGYAFVRNEHSVSAYLRLENTKYVQSVLRDSSGRGRKGVATVPTAAIDKMRRQAEKEVHQGIGIGDKVRITTGVYRNIEATVIEEIPEDQTVQVHVQLRSKQSIVTIPRSGLVVVERAELSPAVSQLTIMRSWLRMARPVLLNQTDPSLVLQAFARYEQVALWIRNGFHLYAVSSFAVGGFAKSRRLILDKMRLLEGVAELEMAATVQAFRRTRLTKIRNRLDRLSLLDSFMSRVGGANTAADAIAHKNTRGRKGNDMVQNLLVDGHNLAFRCMYAPGMSDLKDDEGRPTGIIMGFLRSLGALKKRFPNARLYVAWDGSSQRRRRVFADYKGTRPVAGPRPEFDQFDFLAKALPLFGVRQLTNQDEEADDILASFARCQLKGQQNLIFSNDRDLLQLVTDTTRQLIPGTGMRKEILYDAALVESDFGVPPAQLVQLRSFCGDTSDNIPGVPRVPKKVLRSLVQAYGTIDGVYKSGLAGLSKGQYERLRTAEPQVRINQELMSLVDVEVLVTEPDVDEKAAKTLLESVNIKSKPILEALLRAEG